MSKQKFKRNKKMIELFRKGNWTYRKLAKKFKLSYQRIGLLIVRFVRKEERDEIFWDNHKS